MKSQPHSKTFNISNSSFYVSWGLFVAIEAYSLYRFSTICKQNTVIGTTEGF